MTAAKRDGEHQKYTSLKKESPLVPRYILQRYQYIRERHMDKSARLANILFQNGDI
jgi:hypothetical protein